MISYHDEGNMNVCAETVLKWVLTYFSVDEKVVDQTLTPEEHHNQPNKKQVFIPDRHVVTQLRQQVKLNLFGKSES